MTISPTTDYSTMTPWEIAEGWYTEEEIIAAVARVKSVTPDDRGFIPPDVHSPEFGKWLTHQYRLAMQKGVTLARSALPPPPAATGEAEGERSRYERELEAAAAILQKYTPTGTMKAIGLLEVSAALQELVEHHGLKEVEGLSHEEIADIVEAEGERSGVRCFRSADWLWIMSAEHTGVAFDLSSKDVVGPGAYSVSYLQKRSGTKEITPAAALAAVKDWPEGTAKMREILWADTCELQEVDAGKSRFRCRCDWWKFAPVPLSEPRTAGEKTVHFVSDDGAVACGSGNPTVGSINIEKVTCSDCVEAVFHPEPRTAGTVDGPQGPQQQDCWITSQASSKSQDGLAAVVDSLPPSSPDAPPCDSNKIAEALSIGEKIAKRFAAKPELLDELANRLQQEIIAPLDLSKTGASVYDALH